MLCCEHLIPSLELCQCKLIKLQICSAGQMCVERTTEISVWLYILVSKCFSGGACKSTEISTWDEAVSSSTGISKEKRPH